MWLNPRLDLGGVHHEHALAFHFRRACTVSTARQTTIRLPLSAKVRVRK
jgi:hypothetical protein